MPIVNTINAIAKWKWIYGHSNTDMFKLIDYGVRGWPSGIGQMVCKKSVRNYYLA